MKKIVLLFCTLICTNVLMAQFVSRDEVTYQIIGPNSVKVYSYDGTDSVLIIPSHITYNGTNYTVTEIGYYAFNSNDVLISVDIPNSVTSIEEGAFYHCDNLRTLYFNAINCNDFNFTPFYYCPISTIHIGDSVQRIPAYFSYGLNGLTTVTIPNSIDSIGNYAFNNCSNLRNIISLANIPPSLGSYCFSNIPNDATVEVPCSGLQSYMSSSWSNYFSNIEILLCTYHPSSIGFFKIFSEILIT